MNFMNFLIGIPIYTTLSISLCLVLLITATVVDIVTRKIPNYLTFCFMTLGFILTGLINPYDYITKIIALLILFGIGTLKFSGLGDIKLLMAMCMLWQPVYVMLTYAIASILIFIRHFIKHPKGLKNELVLSAMYLRGLQNPPERTVENSAVTTPYLLAAYILLQGGLLICQHF